MKGASNEKRSLLVLGKLANHYTTRGAHEYNVLFYHAFLYILLMLGLANRTLDGQLIQFFVRPTYISDLIHFFSQ